MFWRIPNFAASSPVENILDKETFTLEELLDEEDIIQECKALNTRLINFLRDRTQVAQLLQYIIEDAPEDAENRRIFKFPFIACEIFTCEIDVILKSLVEDEELMDMLFSFLEPNRPHSSLLAGYFSKVVICLMLRKTMSLMNYVQNREGIFRRLVDLIGITSIMEVLVRLVNADNMYPNYMDVMQWLADSDLLEMVVDKLNPSMSPEVHANTAEVLWAIIRNAPSALASKLTSPCFIAKIFSHGLEDPLSKSALVHALSVCISFLDPKRASPTVTHSIRSQHVYEQCTDVNAETVSAMLTKLGDLLKILNVSCEENILPTTYGELRPPFGKHRLKIVEFVSVLLGTGDQRAENQLISCSAIQRILDLFFDYPFNNALHHHVESIIVSCLESKNAAIVDHLFRDCNLVQKFLEADKNPVLCCDANVLTSPTASRQPPRAGYIGHITRIANKIVQLSNNNEHIWAYLKDDSEWMNWQNVLSERNAVENVYKWACGRPTAMQDRRDNDEDEIYDRDYDVTALANNLSQAFRYCVYENDDTNEVHGSNDQDDEDEYFDDDSAEVVISSLRLGDDQERCLFTNSNWFAFQDEKISEEPVSTSALDRLEEIDLNGTESHNSSKGEVLMSGNGLPSLPSMNGLTCPDVPGAGAPVDLEPFQFETRGNDDLFNDANVPDWVGWCGPSDILVDGPTEDCSFPADTVVSVTNGSPMSISESSAEGETGEPDALLFEDDAEFVGVEMEGTVRIDEHVIEGGINGTAATNSRSQLPELRKNEAAGIMEFNDLNRWRVEPEVGVVQE
ncbi:serine/threonine-protein phosphatase 6 regulatory subunit 3-like [Dioscorea cayenensis subsp. rotundata]|uniref:Serine/threonine-protein phosphatase 6 regulatory subunit 3-like n=1 Tax=Dioscorea cayennensis subsp. rotundata TaxID=55577 RepID=A0AB40CJT9_DIOCR|nr:serine/threonine-protein phosphatase 6 regulatory subunit 3-like [Dioscorea cayenensis subsp. rotundata]